MAEHAHPHHQAIHFTLDGRPLVAHEKDLTAGAILRLGGLDPAGYDLAEIRHGQAHHRFKDDELVALNDGEQLVSIRQKAEVG